MHQKIPLKPGLRTYRRAAGITQRELAAELGTTQGTVCKWERSGNADKSAAIKACIRHLQKNYRALARAGI